MTDLIVDFPHRRNRRAVHFADTLQVRIVKRHEDARHELWYTKAEYRAMRLAVREDVLKVRSKAADGSPCNYWGDDDISVCCIGIEHLLTQASAIAVIACRRRCVRAVLQEQARQRMNPSATFRWDAIAAASYVETRRAAVRARKLGKLHQYSIREYTGNL